MKPLKPKMSIIFLILTWWIIFNWSDNLLNLKVFKKVNYLTTQLMPTFAFPTAVFLWLLAISKLNYCQYYYKIVLNESIWIKMFYMGFQLAMTTDFHLVTWQCDKSLKTHYMQLRYTRFIIINKSILRTKFKCLHIIWVYTLRRPSGYYIPHQFSVLYGFDSTKEWPKLKCLLKIEFFLLYYYIIISYVKSRLYNTHR